MDNIRYPIGKFNFSAEVNDDQIPGLIEQIEKLPELLYQSVEGFLEEQLDSPYRPEGWTIRQVVHHIADSHLHGYIRFKLALTADCPTIIAFDETKWGELEDAKNMPVDISLNLIESLHKRWVCLLRSLSKEEFNTCYYHPEFGNFSLKKAMSLYAWHGNHHLGHITNFRKTIGLDT